MTTETKRRSNPPSIHVEEMTLFKEIMGLRAEYGLVRDREFVSMCVQGLPGLGKTYLAEQILSGGHDNRLVPVRAHAANLPDVLHRYRHKRFTLLWDDTNFVFDSAPSMNLLNIAIDPRRARVIPDNRKEGHGNFLVESRHVFLTNKHILTDESLMEFDKNMREMIRPLKSRFHLRRALSQNMEEAFHYSCWLATDGQHLLRDLRTKGGGRSLSVEASNELLNWFAQHFVYLDEISPRRLLTLAEYRLKAPAIWESLCQSYVLTTPRTETVLIGNKIVDRPVAPPPAWTIRTVPTHEKAVRGATLPETDHEALFGTTLPAIRKPTPKTAAQKNSTKKAA